MTRAGVAVLKSAVRAEVFKHRLQGAEVIGALLELAIDHHVDAGLDANQLRTELDKRLLLEAAAVRMGRAS